jgi:hypothetical protein
VWGFWTAAEEAGALWKFASCAHKEVAAQKTATATVEIDFCEFKASPPKNL